MHINCHSIVIMATPTHLMEQPMQYSGTQVPIGGGYPIPDR